MKKIICSAFIAIFASLTTLSVSAQLLYKISSSGHDQPSYIFGTHHLAPLAFIDSIPGFMDAFDDCEVVVGEINMTAGMMQIAKEVQPYMMAAPDERLSALVPKETYDSIAQNFDSICSRSGMTLHMLDMLKPIAISSIITQCVIADDLPDIASGQQLDSYIQILGTEHGKTILGLETPAQQADILYNTTPADRQAADLVEMLRHPDHILSEIRALNDAYFSQDPQAILLLTDQQASDSQFLEALLLKRNLDWSKKIPALIDQHPTFIAVGALHLPGDHGVLKILENAGYEISAVK